MAVFTSTHLCAYTLFLFLIKDGLAGGVIDKASICTPSTITSTSIIVNTITVTLPASTTTTTTHPLSKSKVPRGYSYQDPPKGSTAPPAGSLSVSHKSPSSIPTQPAQGYVTCAASTSVVSSTSIKYLTIPGPLVTVTASGPEPINVNDLIAPPRTGVPPTPLVRASTRTSSFDLCVVFACDNGTPLQGTPPPNVDELLADPPIFNDQPPVVVVRPATPTPQPPTPTPPPAVAPLPNSVPSPVNPEPVQVVSLSPEPAPGAPSPAVPAPNVIPSPEPAQGVSISAAPALGVPSPVAPAPGVSPSPEPAPGVSPSAVPALGASSAVVPAPGVLSSSGPTPNVPSPNVPAAPSTAPVLGIPSPAASPLAGTARGSLSPIAPVPGITTTTRAAPSATTSAPVQFTGAAYRDMTGFGRSALLGLIGLLVIWV